MSKLTIRDVELANKHVFIRVDFNVPLSEDGSTITDDTRIVATLPTILYALEHKAKVILASHLGRPKGDPKKDMAMDFIRYATGTMALAHAADWIALGPARRSSWPKVGDNPDLKIAMSPLLPTRDFATAFAVDDGWWLTHGARLETRFQAWKSN